MNARTGIDGARARIAFTAVGQASCQTPRRPHPVAAFALAACALVAASLAVPALALVSLTGVQAVAGGQFNTCAVVDGGVQCWGSGQLGDGGVNGSNVPVMVFPAGSGATAVAAGQNHRCAVVNGGVQCWGGGGSANGPAGSSTVPVVALPAGSGATAVSASSGHTCAVVSGGVQCWGSGTQGQLGNGSTASSSTPVVAMPAGSGVTAVRAFANTSCAVANGGVQCWGNGSGGALGNGSTADSLVPVVAIPAGSAATSIGGGRLHTCAVVNGGVQCWGSNISGSLGDGTTSPRSVPVVALPAGSGATDVSPGNFADHTCAVVNGGVKCWGSNSSGQIGTGTTSNSALVPVETLPPGSGASAVAVGQSHSCAVVNGGMQCWGENADGQLSNGTGGSFSNVPVEALAAGSGATDVAAAADYSNNFGHSCAVVNGGVQCWGSDSDGKLGDGATTPVGGATSVAVTAFAAGSGATAVAAGSRHTCAIVDGAVWCWGQRSFGRLGDGGATSSGSVNAPIATLITSGATALAAGESHTCAIVNGGVQCWGIGGTTSTSVTSVPVVAIPAASGATDVAAGSDYTCAVVNNGVKCWGTNLHGQLGNGSTSASDLPVEAMAPGSGATAVAAGPNHACAVVNGGVRCWGYGGQGNLGNGSTSSSSVPVVALPDGSGVIAVAASSWVSTAHHSCALTAGGGVKCWGYNGDGEVGDGTTVQRLVPVDVVGLDSGTAAIGAGGGHSCAVINGGVKCWGYGANAELGDNRTGFATVPWPVLTRASDTVTLSASSSTPAIGQSLTLTATISPSDATGTVTFKDGATTITGCSSRLVTAGQATCTTSALAAGMHALIATYSGDANYVNAVSTPINVQVGTPTITIAPSTLSNGTVGSSYSAIFAASGGQSPYTFSIVSGTCCPPGTIFGTSTSTSATLSGTLTAVGLSTYSFTLQATDANGFAGTQAYAITITPATSSVSLTSSANSVTFGQQLTLTATMSPSAASGSVTFKDGTQTLGVAAISSGVASFTTNVLAAGSHSLTAEYAGDANYLASTSASISVDVSGAATATAYWPADGTPNEAVSNRNGVLVNGASFGMGVVGSAFDLDGSNDYVSVADDDIWTFGGDFSIALWVNLDAIRAGFAGTLPNVLVGHDQGAGTQNKWVFFLREASPGQIQLGFHINGSSSIFLASPSTAAIGVGEWHHYALTRSGSTYTFFVDGVSLGTASSSVPLPNALAPLIFGQAEGLGYLAGRLDEIRLYSEALTASQVAQLASITTVTSSLNPSTFGDSVTFTATVTGVNPTGAVDFKDGGSTIAGCAAQALTSGQATCTTSALNVGSHGITAAYSGDANNVGSTSTTLTQTINVATVGTTTTLASSLNPSPYGEVVTFTATVTGSSPTGTVRFKDGGTTIVGCVASPLVAGQAQCMINILGVGDHEVTAQYLGDAGNNPSISAALAQTITVTTGDTTPMLAAGRTHTCALGSGGGVQCWGRNDFGQLGDSTTTDRLTPISVQGLETGVLAITTGGEHSCALLATGGMKCWGYNLYGQLGDGSSTNRLIPVDVSGLTGGVAAIAAGHEHTCALTDSGGVKCWGRNQTGQLGDGTQANRSSPADVTDLSSGIVGIGSAQLHSCAVTSGGGVKCWGGNDFGQLGDNSNTMRLAPTDVVGLGSGVASLAIAGGYSCALTDAGGVKCWGVNGVGQLGDGTSTNRSTPVDTVGLAFGVSALAAGGGHACALTAAGGMKCWGYNGTGQLGDGTQANRSTPTDVVGLTSGVAAMAAGGDHTCALVNGGGVKCWGYNVRGQLGDGTTLNRSTASLFVTGLNLTQTPALVSSLNPSSAGESVTFTVTVTGLNPTGTVQFKDGTGTIPSCAAQPLSAGQALCSTSALTTGSHNISAAYSGDANNPGVTSSVLTQTVNAAVSSTTLASSLNPSSYAQAVTFTAAVSGASPMGTVTFNDAAATIAGCSTVALADGQATCNTSSLGGGSHAITAAYSGDSNNTSSTSPVLTQAVNPIATSITVASSLNPSNVGDSVTFTATVTGIGATGVVEFKDGATTIAGCSAQPLSGNQSNCSTNVLGSGSHSITAVYSGDANNVGSTSSALTQTVNAVTVPTTTTVVSSLNPSSYGDVVTFTATVSGNSPTGTVHFKDDGTTIVGCVAIVLAAGQAQCNINVLKVGSHSITAEYRGDGANVASTSAALAQVVAVATGDTTPMIAAGEFQTCALTSGGGVKCWGANNAGELGDGTTTDQSTPVDVVGLSSGVTAIAAGHTHTCALTSSGGVKCWGNNFYGQLGDSTTFRRLTPVDVVGLASGVSAIAAGYSYTCALTSGGGVKCWGDNLFGQLGDGTTTGRLTPVDVVGLADGVSAIAARHVYTCALTSGGGVKCWGDNTQGPLGDGTTTRRLTPVDVVELASGVSAIATGLGHTCAVTSGGGVKCWGYNGSGQLGDGTMTRRLTPVNVVGLASGVSAITAGGDHTCALTNGGGVKCWGGNGGGTPVDVVGLASGVSTIAAGVHHSCALITSGGVKCWGGNDYGQLGDSTQVSRSTASLFVTGLNLTQPPPALVSSLNPSTAGQSVTFTTTIATPSPTGTAEFKDGASTIAGCAARPVNGGQATCTTNTLAAGTHSVSAIYSGDAANGPNTSGVLTQIVTPLMSTTTALTASPNPSTSGQSVTFTATVGGGVNATGTVQFTDGGSPISGCSAQALDGSGVATCSTSGLAVGAHTITAIYGGDANHATSTSAAVTQTVNPLITSTTTTLASSSNPSTFGSVVTFTATVAGSSPTGAVTFSDGGNAIAGCGAVALASGQAACATNTLAVGSHSIIATYSGDSGNAPSNSSALSQTVNAVTTTTQLQSSTETATVGDTVTFTATVTGGSPSGTVAFNDGASAIGGCGNVALSGNMAMCSTSELAAGSHLVTAVYSGDASHAGSTSAAVAVAITAPVVVAPSAVDYIFFSDYGTQSVWRMKPDGTAATQILTGLSNVRGLAVDLGAGKLYFVEQNPTRIRRANLDGTAPEAVVTGTNIGDVELDLVHGKMYWTEGVIGIRRANLDGSGNEALPLTGIQNPSGLAVDADGGKVYWSDYFAGTISRANLDGTGQQTLISGLAVPHGPNHIALDLMHGHLYWTQTNQAQVMRSNLDGTGVVTLVSGETLLSGLILDLAAGKMYWTRETNGLVRRANLDGTSVETVVSGLVAPLSFAIISAPIVPGATPTGGDVPVDLTAALPNGSTAPIAIVFDNVVTAGQTSVTTSTQGPPPPSGFKLGTPPVYYDVSTTATFNGTVELCFTWTEGQFHNEGTIRLRHYESGAWQDVTSFLDTTNNVVCGVVTSLSPFVLLEEAYLFAGFFQPVDNMPVLNSVKAGQAVPVKFSLGGNRGLDIFPAGYPASQTVSCAGFAGANAVEQTVTAGASGLLYDSSNDQYSYIWKTNAAWANTCRVLILKFKDGTERQAAFQFTR